LFVHILFLLTVTDHFTKVRGYAVQRLKEMRGKMFFARIKMSTRKLGFWAALVAACFWLPALTQAQVSSGAAGGYDLKLGRISYQLMQTPDYRAFDNGMTPGLSTMLSAKWLRIEVQFESRLEWVDDVQIKYYVLMGKGQDARLFVGEITHVNVARGSNHYSAMFIHPNTVERYGRGQIEAVAAQIFYKNRLMGQDSVPPSGAPWWEKRTPTPGFLLPPQQTPWSLSAYGRYEAVKATP
jgi:hypothetical protein